MAQVFISYSRKDLSFVDKLAADLKNAGVDVWYDVSGIGGGSRWRSEIENALRSSQYVIVVLSPDAVTSEWVEREILFSSNLKRKIIPLMYRLCELPLNYVNLNYIDVQGDNYQREFPNLLRALAFDPKTAALLAAKVKKPSFLLTPKYFVSIIGVIVVIFGGLFVWQLSRNWSSPALIPTSPISIPQTGSTEIALPTSAADDSPTLFTPTLVPEMTLPTAAPMEISTTVLPTAFEASGPKMKKDDLSSVLSVLISGSLDQSLRNLAIETYSEADYASSTDFNYTISRERSEDLIWHWHWCTKDAAILIRNFVSITVDFAINEQPIPLGEFVEDQYMGSDRACRVYYVTLFDWPTGTHHLVNTVTFTQPINDGWDDYPAQTRTYDYLVYIQP